MSIISFLTIGDSGMAIQFSRDQKNFWVIALFFILTGMAIVVYLNQYPLQPRNAIILMWALLRVLHLGRAWGPWPVRSPQKGFKSGLMASSCHSYCAFQFPPYWQRNWDDHDRSGRYITAILHITI